MNKDGIYKTHRRNALCKEILGRMLDVVVRERRHKVVAVVVVVVITDLDALDARLLGGLFEVLRKQLALLVEVVSIALSHISPQFFHRLTIPGS